MISAEQVIRHLVLLAAFVLSSIDYLTALPNQPLLPLSVCYAVLIYFLEGSSKVFDEIRLMMTSLVDTDKEAIPHPDGLPSALPVLDVTINGMSWFDYAGLSVFLFSANLINHDFDFL